MFWKVATFLFTVGVIAAQDGVNYFLNMRQFWPLFCFIFVLFTLQFKFKLKKAKRRCCAWDSNQGPQDGRRRRIHWAMAGHFIATTDCGKEIHILMFYSVHLPTKVSSFESSPLHPSPAAAAVACISLAADIVNDTKSFSAQENCKLLNHYKMSQVLEIWVRGFFWRRVQVGPSPASSKLQKSYPSSSTRCSDLNSWPLEYMSPPITTMLWASDLATGLV